MAVHTIDIDSGERDASLYPNPNAYTIDLKTPVFDVTKLEVTSARIPTPNFVIHDNNNRFSVRIDAPAPDAGTYTVSLNERHYPNGTTLASEILTAISNAGVTTIDNVEFISAQDSLKFSNVASSDEFALLFRSGVDGWDSNVLTRTTPNQVFGMPARDISSSNSIIDLEGRVDFECGPKTYVVKITAGSDVLGQTVFSNNPFYTGTFMAKSTISEQYTTFFSNDDPVTHEFTGGAQKQIDSLRIEWFYKENNKLVPVDFRDRDHAVKLRLSCETDRRKPLSKKFEMLSKKLPTPVKIFDDDPGSVTVVGEKEDASFEKWVPIAVIVTVGFAVLLWLSGRSRTSAPTA